MAIDAPDRPATFAQTGPAPTVPAASRHTGAVLRTPEPTAALDRLGDEIAELSAHLEAATARLLNLIREFDARGGWNTGFRSCAEWLSWRVGLDPGAAREKVRVARALGTLPALAQALACGELSYAKVRALTRVATPETEARLLAVGRAGTAAHVERIVRGWRWVDRQTETRETARQHASRSLQVYPDEDGMLIVRGRLEPEVGALLLLALDAARAALHQRRTPGAAEATLARGGVEPRTAGAYVRGNVALRTSEPLPSGSEPRTAGSHVPGVDPGDRAVETGEGPANPSAAAATPVRPSAHSADPSAPAPTMAQQQADALTLLAETALHHGLDPGTPGERYQVVVHVDAAVLADPEQPGQSVLEDGARVSAETSQRLACDASRVVMRHDTDGRTLEVGARTRTIPPALRRALDHRDRGCRFPGCGLRYTQGHHLRHWAQGGPTTLSNLALLCRRHHRAVHEEGYRVNRQPDGVLRFLRPDGRPLPEVPPTPGVPREPVQALRTQHEAQGLRLDAHTTCPSWMGERLDLAWAIDVLHPLANPRG